MKALLPFGHQFGNPYLYISCGCHKYIEPSVYIVVFVCLDFRPLPRGQSTMLLFPNE